MNTLSPALSSRLAFYQLINTLNFLWEFVSFFTKIDIICNETDNNNHYQ